MGIHSICISILQRRKCQNEFPLRNCREEKGIWIDEIVLEERWIGGKIRFPFRHLIWTVNSIVCKNRVCINDKMQIVEWTKRMHPLCKPNRFEKRKREDTKWNSTFHDLANSLKVSGKCLKWSQQNGIIQVKLFLSNP